MGAQLPPVSGKSRFFATGGAALSLADIASGATAGYYNFRPENFLRWRAALAKMRRGVRNARLGFAGDSTTKGTNNSVGNLQAGQAASSQLVPRLVGAGIPAVWQSFFGGGSTGDRVNDDDSRVVLTGSMTLSSTQTATSLGGPMLSSNAVGGINFTPAGTFDTFDIYYAQGGGFGSFTAAVDGGAVLATVNTSGSDAILKQTVTTTLGAHTINVARSAGLVFIIGIDAYNSTQKAISVLNFGWPGATSVVLRGASAPFNYRPALQFAALDLLILDVGINNWRQAGFSPTDYKVDLQSIISAVLPTTDIILKSPVPSQPGAINTLQAFQQEFVDAMLSVAADNGGLPMLDTWRRWGSYAIQDPNGFYDDGFHPSSVGYADVMEHEFQGLMKAA